MSGRKTDKRKMGKSEVKLDEDGKKRKIAQQQMENRWKQQKRF